MLRSPFLTDVRGIESCIQAIEKEGIIPMVLLGFRVTKTGLDPVVMDASSCEDEEEVRVSLARHLVVAIASKLRE